MSYVSGWTGPIIVKRVRDAIILALRTAFSTDTLFPYIVYGPGNGNLTGTVNFDCSAIVINDGTADTPYFLPAINVMSIGGEETRFLQEDFMEQFTDTNGSLVTRRGAPIDFSVTVEATALDIITRDKLVDRLYERLKLVIDDLTNNGVAVVKTSIMRDRRNYVNARWYYTSGVEIKLFAEWLEEDVIDPNSTINKISTEIYTPGHEIDQKFKI